jgi:hypothetical protein
VACQWIIPLYLGHCSLVNDHPASRW